MPSAPPKRQQIRAVLDDLLAAPDSEQAVRAQTPAGAASIVRAKSTSASQRFTIGLDSAIADRARDAVYHSPGLTLAGLIATALTSELDRLEHERGQPFPARPGPLRPGRPVR